MTTIVSGERRRMTLAELRQSMQSRGDCTPSDNQGRTHSTGVSGDHQTTYTDPVYPLLDERILLSALRCASEARGKRKQMREPPLGTMKVHAKTQGRGRKSGFSRMRRYLNRLGTRALNDLARRGHAHPTVEQLNAAFDVIVQERLSKFEKSSAHSGGERPSKFEKWAYVDEAGVERLTELCAAETIRDWDPDFLKVAALRGRVGGTRSRRAPLWLTDGSLEKLAALDGETVAEQARALKLSTATIERMRRYLRERARAETKEIRSKRR